MLLSGSRAMLMDDEMGAARFWGGGSGLQRTDGVLHSQLINTLVKNILPQLVSFDPKNVSPLAPVLHPTARPHTPCLEQVFFSGVSGGSLLLSGFFLPAHLDQFNTGALLACAPSRAIPPFLPSP